MTGNYHLDGIKAKQQVENYLSRFWGVPVRIKAQLIPSDWMRTADCTKDETPNYESVEMIEAHIRVLRYE